MTAQFIARNLPLQGDTVEYRSRVTGKRYTLRSFGGAFFVSTPISNPYEVGFTLRKTAVEFIELCDGRAG